MVLSLARPVDAVKPKSAHLIRPHPGSSRTRPELSDHERAEIFGIASTSKPAATALARVILILLAVLPMVACAPPPVSTAPRSAATKAVLVTVASTGIGRKIAERLAAHGYYVYAAARKDSDLQALRAIKNVQPVRLDVTKLRISMPR
jgi:hypothetical protein